MPKGRQRIIPVPIWKWVLAYVALGFGVVGFFVGFDKLAHLPAFLSNLALVLMFWIPSVWWLYCTARDEREAARIADIRKTHAQTSQWLGPQDTYYAGALSIPLEAKRMNRRWPIVMVLIFVCFGFFGMLSPDTNTGISGDPDSSASTTE